MAENLPHRTPATTPMQTVEWQSDLADRLRAVFPPDKVQLLSYLEQPFAVLRDADMLSAFLRHLQDAEQLDMLTDLTAVDRQPANPRFEVIYILYSFTQNLHLRVKVHPLQEKDEYVLPSITSLWLGADWMEREVFDLFGIRFNGHPHLTRILMPDGWKGFPLRKDYSITAADEDWVRENIEPCRTENS